MKGLPMMDLHPANEASSDRSDSRVSSVEEKTAALRKLASDLSLAEIRERRRIADDLHDNLAQYLALIRMKLSEFQGNTVFCGYESDLVEIQDLLDKAIRYTRHLTMAISPPILYQLGLTPALDWLAGEYSRRYDLAIRVKAGNRRYMIDEDMRGLIYRFVRELLLNAIKHAHAHTVDVFIRTHGDRIEVTVTDDGIGFDPGAIDSNRDTGFGLFSIRERLTHLGGDLQLSTCPGKGSTIMFRCPVHREITP
ncbi:sensor histidine kinase [bacterium]|nr:sensor histidine kinase [candidate division CSSED10-310 bacterium]